MYNLRYVWYLGVMEVDRQNGAIGEKAHVVIGDLVSSGRSPSNCATVRNVFPVSVGFGMDALIAKNPVRHPSAGLMPATTYDLSNRQGGR